MKSRKLVDFIKRKKFGGISGTLNLPSSIVNKKNPIEPHQLIYHSPTKTWEQILCFSPEGNKIIQWSHEELVIKRFFLFHLLLYYHFFSATKSRIDSYHSMT